MNIQKPLSKLLSEKLDVPARHDIYSPSKYTDSAKGKVVFITGASGKGGIGVMTGLAFAKAGAKIFLVARRAEGPENLKRAILEDVPGAEVETFVVDVVKGEDVEDAVKVCLERFGKIDVVVSNAGQSASWKDSTSLIRS